jgi:hypothetical protein
MGKNAVIIRFVLDELIYYVIYIEKCFNVVNISMLPSISIDDASVH